MRCSICGIQIDSVDEAVEEGWTPDEPYRYDSDVVKKYPPGQQKKKSKGKGKGKWD